MDLMKYFHMYSGSVQKHLTGNLVKKKIINGRGINVKGVRTAYVMPITEKRNREKCTELQTILSNESGLNALKILRKQMDDIC